MNKQIMKQYVLSKYLGMTILIALLVSVVTGIATAETGDVLWYNTYNFHQGDDYDQYECYAIHQTDDGGYILTGNVDYANDSELNKALLIKLDENRDTVWVRTYGPEADYCYYGREVVLTSDGCYLLAGYTMDRETYTEGLGAFLIKYDVNGDTIWTNYYADGEAIYFVYDAFEIDDGGFVMFGYKYHGDEFGFGIKADSDGNEIWVKDYDTPYTDHEYFMVLCATPTDDGGFVLGAETKYWDGPEIISSGMIMKVDANGDTLWTNNCGRSYSEFADIHVTSDGGYMVSGTFWGDERDIGTGCYLISKYDSTFEEEFFDYEYFPPGECSNTPGYCRAMCELPDNNGYMGIGWKIYMTSHGSGDPFIGCHHQEPMLMYVDNNGGYAYRIYTDEFSDLYNYYEALYVKLWNIQITDEGNYLVCGFVDAQSEDEITDDSDRGKIFIAELEGGELMLSIDDEAADAVLPEAVALSQNYPNPFNATTSIQFSLNKSDDVTLSVYDILGRKVNTLYSGSLSAGTHSITWNGADDSGNVVSSGIYFYRLETSDNVSTKQMLLLK